VTVALMNEAPFAVCPRLITETKATCKRVGQAVTVQTEVVLREATGGRDYELIVDKTLLYELSDALGQDSAL